MLATPSAGPLIAPSRGFYANTIGSGKIISPD
jgi:hypothetical protein